MSLRDCFKNFRDIENCENPGKVIGIVGAIAVVTGLAYAAAKCIGNWIDSMVQTNADKKREDYRAQKAMDVETHRAEEERATKEAQAHAQAEAYAIMRKADAELYREKKEIDLEKRQRYLEFSQPTAQEQVHGDSTLDTAPGFMTSEDVFSPSRRSRSTGWIVDGYSKPGQITLLAAGSGVGKSSLLAQIALATAKGERPEFLPDSCQTSLKQDVVYYRIEDFPAELEGKYGKGRVFDYADIKWVLPENLDGNSLTAFLDHVKGLARKLKRDTLVCVDPATKLDGYSPEACIKGLEEAQRISEANGITLSFIVAAHVDEIKDWKHLTTENIKGGDKGVQQAGAVLALRMEGTAGGDHRFIQCLKAPKGDPMPFPQGVLVCKSVKTQLDKDNWYLHFEYVEIKPEKEALPKKPKASKGTDKKATGATSKPKKKGNTKVNEGDAERMAELKAQGKTYEEIVEELDLPIGPEQVGRIVRAKAKNKDQEGDQAA